MTDPKATAMVLTGALAELNRKRADREYVFISHDQLDEVISHIAKLQEQNDKFMWQVRDTCTRAEKAETDLTASRQETAQASDRLRVLEDAIKPFAVLYKPHHATLPDTTVAYGLADMDLYVGDLRHAAMAGEG